MNPRLRELNFGQNVVLTVLSPPSVGTMVTASEATPEKSPPLCVARHLSEYSRFVDVVSGRVITKVWKCRLNSCGGSIRTKSFNSYLRNRRWKFEIRPIIGVRVDSAYVDVELGLPVDERIPVKCPLEGSESYKDCNEGLS